MTEHADKKTPKPASKFTEEQREAFKYLWPDLPGGKRRESMEEQFKREMGEKKP